jgi:hypothetical protein
MLCDLVPLFKTIGPNKLAVSP